MGAKKIYHLSIAFSDEDDACEYLMEEMYEDEDEIIADCEYEEALESLMVLKDDSASISLREFMQEHGDDFSGFPIIGIT